MEMDADAPRQSAPELYDSPPHGTSKNINEIRQNIAARTAARVIISPPTHTTVRS
jgi:hypothetical protein